MHAAIEFPSQAGASRIFLTWTPIEATVRLVGATGPAPVRVTLSSTGPVGGLVLNTVRSDTGTASLDVTLPADGSPVTVWVAGEFQKPSRAYGDAELTVVDRSDGATLGSLPVMVRIRKDAQTLPAPERDRFLNALGTLNAKGLGIYRAFREMHEPSSYNEMHGNVGFLPWHRAFVLDLERALQAIDDTVTVPYWRFDAPAPALFTQDFMGEPSGSSIVKFRPGHPLQNWVVSGRPGIVRTPEFSTARAPRLRTEKETFALEGVRRDYAGFVHMEDDPHGEAHVSFNPGVDPITDPGTAVQDSLFFLLHANVDRLWAKWQWLRHRADARDDDAFAPARDDRIGHRRPDTMWPWNGVVTKPRPPYAPGGGFHASGMTPAPGRQPTVASMFDHLAVLGGDHLGFAYDDVPFEFPPVAVAAGTSQPVATRAPGIT